LLIIGITGMEIIAVEFVKYMPACMCMVKIKSFFFYRFTGWRAVT